MNGNCNEKGTPWYKKLLSTLLGTGNCHGEVNQDTHGLDKIALVGSPNVGVKSNTALASLSDLANDESGTIVELATKDKDILRKLMSMGVLPGMSVRVILKYPSYVLQVGFTQVALDAGIASVIVVDRHKIAQFIFGRERYADTNRTGCP